MKKSFFVFVIVWLYLAGSFVSCEKKGESRNDVTYKPCDCSCDEFERPYNEMGNMQLKEVFLFKDSVPEQTFVQINEELLKGKQVSYIIFDSETDHVEIDILPIQGSGNIICTGRICNFPDFAKEWIISKNGVKVDVRGVTYEPCWGGLANRSYFDYILTSLKKR